MMRVHKYLVPSKEFFSIDMPEGAQVLAFQEQHHQPQLWALVDDTKPLKPRPFMLKGTGSELEGPGRYIGTAQFNGGSLVFHLFDCSESS